MTDGFNERGLFMVQDPALRSAVMPLFGIDRRDLAERPQGRGTAFRIDPWGGCATAYHVIEELLVAKDGRPALREHVRLIALELEGIPYGTPVVKPEQWRNFEEMFAVSGMKREVGRAPELRNVTELASLQITGAPRATGAALHLGLDLRRWRPVVGDKVTALGFAGLDVGAEGEESDALRPISQDLYGSTATIRASDRGRLVAQFDAECRCINGAESVALRPVHVGPEAVHHGGGFRPCKIERCQGLSGRAEMEDRRGVEMTASAIQHVREHEDLDFVDREGRLQLQGDPDRGRADRVPVHFGAFPHREVLHGCLARLEKGHRFVRHVLEIETVDDRDDPTVEEQGVDPLDGEGQVAETAVPVQCGHDRVWLPFDDPLRFDDLRVAPVRIRHRGGVIGVVLRPCRLDVPLEPIPCASFASEGACEPPRHVGREPFCRGRFGVVATLGNADARRGGGRQPVPPRQADPVSSHQRFDDLVVFGRRASRRIQVRLTIKGLHPCGPLPLRLFRGPVHRAHRASDPAHELSSSNHMPPGLTIGPVMPAIAGRLRVAKGSCR